MKIIAFKITGQQELQLRAGMERAHKKNLSEYIRHRLFAGEPRVSATRVTGKPGRVIVQTPPGVCITDEELNRLWEETP